MASVSSCVALQANVNEGLCLPGCYQANAAACASGTTCIVKTEPEWHEGTCVGQATPCDPVAQSGCPTGHTCEIVGGLMFSGYSVACTSFVGTLQVGEKCVPTMSACSTGLACVNKQCRRFCDKDGPPCATGTCTDVSPSFYRALGEVSVCL